MKCNRCSEEYDGGVCPKCGYENQQQPPAPQNNSDPAWWLSQSSVSNSSEPAPPNHGAPAQEPPAPVYPVQQDYSQPEQPNYSAPAQEPPAPVYPVQQDYSQPEQPSYSSPAQGPPAPVYPVQQNYSQPAQPSYGAPAQEPPAPVYPVQQDYSQPEQPNYGAPAQEPPAPVYPVQQNYSQPTQPNYGAPAQEPPAPVYPVQQNYSQHAQPSYGAPTQGYSNSQTTGNGVPPQGYPGQQFPPAPPKKEKTALIVLIVIAVIVVIGIGVIALVTNSISNAGKKFGKDIAQMASGRETTTRLDKYELAALLQTTLRDQNSDDITVNVTYNENNNTMETNISMKDFGAYIDDAMAANSPTLEAEWQRFTAQQVAFCEDVRVLLDSHGHYDVAVGLTIYDDRDSEIIMIQLLDGEVVFDMLADYDFPMPSSSIPESESSLSSKHSFFVPDTQYLPALHFSS